MSRFKGLFNFSRRRAGQTVLAAVIVVLLLVYAGFRVNYQDRIFPNVVMLGVDVGGLRKEEAAKFLDGKFTDFKISLNYDQRHWERNIEQLDGGYDAAASAARAFDYGRRGLSRSLAQGFLSVFSAPRLDPVIKLSDDAVEDFIFGVEQEVNKIPRHRGVAVKKREIVFTEPKDGLLLDRAFLSQAIKISFLSGRENVDVKVNVVKPPEVFFGLEEAKETARKIISRPLALFYRGNVFYLGREQIGEFINTIVNDGKIDVILEEIKIAGYVSMLGEKYNHPAEDLTVRLNGGRAVFFQEGRSGEIIDVEKAIADIHNALMNRAALSPADWPTAITLVSKVVLPRIKEKDVTELGIKELIGRGQTSFAGSPANRVANIKNGVKFLNGILVPPGEEFSTLKALGEIDGSTGYLPELVIKENATVPEFGGGLCQVSTTLFRSLINFGFPITARRNHSYRVSYYEPPVGLDATIYSPDPDLRFINDTPGHILIRGYVTGTDLFFEIYGTHDGRKAEIEGPFVSHIVPPPPPVYLETNALLPGETKQMEKPHEGADAVAKYIIRDKNGNILKEQIFRSHYKAWPAKFLVGIQSQDNKNESAAPSGDYNFQTALPNDAVDN